MERTTLSNLRGTKACRFFVTCTRIRTFATVIALVAGCGGPGPDGTADGVPSLPGDPSGEVMSGVLAAPATAGVSYETASLSGVTSEDGSFEYREGESVRFFLGDTTLGEVSGQDEVTPFDLAGIEPLTTGVRGFKEARKELSRAANVSTLLQTFDDDADPINGVEITSEVGALFDGIEVDLDRDIFDFAREHTFRSVLNRANEDELFDAHRRPRGGIAVMNDLYAELDLSPGFFAPLSATFDDDGDGQLDAVREYTYEELRSGVTLTDLASTAKQRVTVTEFDEDGNQASELETEQGEVVFFKRSVIDVDGNVVLVSLDLLGDGIVESSTTNLRDEFGRLSRAEHDDDADGAPDRVGSYEYDERGNQSRFEWDSDADGVPDHVELLVWSPTRNLLGLEVDADGDGWFESFEAFDYDDESRLLGRAHYLNGEADPGRVRIWEHDADGLLSRASEDEDGDGTFDTITDYEHDEAGRRIAEHTDDDGDGVIDRAQTWAYDSDGNETRLAYDFDADGSTDSVVTYAYDADGNRTLEETDQNADGVPEHVVRRSFAPLGWGYLFYELRDRLSLDATRLR